MEGGYDDWYYLAYPVILNLLNALKSRVSEHLILLIALAIISAAFVHNNVLWRWDNLVYDAQLSVWHRQASEDVIIIAIDDESLRQVGRWPWPRSNYAELINKLELESPRSIGLDIIFSEPDVSDPDSDYLLAEAMRDSRKVVLPLFMSQGKSQFLSDRSAAITTVYAACCRTWSCAYRCE